MAKPYIIEDFTTIYNQLVWHEQRRRPCSEYVAAVGDEVRVGDFVKFGTVRCSPTNRDVPPTPHAIAFSFSTVLGQVLSYLDNEVGVLCCKVNLYLKQGQVPSRVSMPGIDTVPRRILFVQTNITVIMPVIDIREVALVLHRQSFKEEHNGYMNVYACENQLDCVRCVAAVKDTATHKASSQDMYTGLVDFVSFPVLMYEMCFKVYGACATMLCRIAQSQLPTNLCRIDMHPGIWRMLKNTLQTQFRSDNHPFYMDKVPSVITASRIQFTNNIMQLETRLIDNDPDRHYTDRVKCYTREMVLFLQSHCFGATFGVGARCPIPSRPEPDDIDDYNTSPVTHGTRVNIITHLPTAENYGPGMSSFRRAGVDGLTLLYERHPAQLVIKLRYDSPYVEDAINNGYIPLSYSHFPLPIIGYLFNLDGIPREVISYEGGATVAVQTNGQEIINMSIDDVLLIMQQSIVMQQQRDHDRTVARAEEAVACANE
jgi:hypothetical protein